MSTLFQNPFTVFPVVNMYRRFCVLFSSTRVRIDLSFVNQVCPKGTRKQATYI